MPKARLEAQAADSKAALTDAETRLSAKVADLRAEFETQLADQASESSAEAERLLGEAEEAAAEELAR